MSDLKTVKDLLKQLMDVVHEGMIVIQDEEIIQVNRVFADLLEYAEDDLLDMEFEDLLDPVAKRQHQNHIDALLDGAQHEKFTTRMKSKTGRTFHVEVNPRVIEIGGNPAIVAAVQDISGQIALQEAVMQLEQRFASLYDFSPVAYFTLNADGIVTQVNEASEILLGCDADNILGHPITSFFKTSTDTGAFDPGGDIVGEVMRGKSVSGIELEMDHCSGKSLWASISARTLNPESATPNEIGLTAVDITRRRRAEQKLREESERANLYFDLMTSDLNIILQSVIFALEDLKVSVELPPREVALVRDASWNLRRAARLIVNMGVLLSLDRAPPTTMKTKLAPHLKRAYIEVQRDFEGKKLEYESKLDDDNMEVVGHAFLHNVFFNILHNSMTYDMKEKVSIKVQAEAQDYGREIKVEFLDSGPGISDDMKQKVFRRTPEDDARHMGKGLGLTVADRYIRHLGGRIWVEDRVKGDPSKGSKFVVIIPRWQEELELPIIDFYKSDHCVFCGPVLDTLTTVLDELGIGRSSLNIINIDDPTAGVSEDDLPALPTIHIGDEELTGFLSEEDIRMGVMRLLMTSSQR
ncbi:MAG: PAS domain S-box protein [Candidatus Thorarchaeota archaeon]